jgi:hypothetical protein
MGGRNLYGSASVRPRPLDGGAEDEPHETPIDHDPTKEDSESTVLPAHIPPPGHLRIRWPAAAGDAGISKEDASESVVLPARIVPPARLHIRWLAAASDAGLDGGEAQDHPTQGPICGWLVPNALEGRLMVHHASGEAIGSIDQGGRWRPPPGVDRFLPPEDIDNVGLRQLVLQLLHETAVERSGLLEQFMESLETIEPDSHAQHRALALLMGRPIAVVRARVRLELLGHPPVNQSWDSFRSQLAGGPADTAGLDLVRFPVRVGEPGQLDDGVVGFWVERDGDAQGNGTRFDGPFYAPQSAKPVTATSTVEPGGRDGASPSTGGHFDLTLDGDALCLTVLMDPRGKLHATSGILPTKVLDIPHEQYATAFDTIGVTFLTSPLLCDPGTVQVALPSEPGYVWSWLEQSTDGWSETAGSDIDAPTTQARLTGQQHIREGWLKLAPAPTRRGGQG